MKNDELYELLKEVKHKLDDVAEKAAIRAGESRAEHEDTHEKLKVIDTRVQELSKVQIIQGYDIAKNKESLVEHMDNNKKLETIIHKVKGGCDSRLDKIEEPKKVRKYLLDAFFKVGTFAGAAYAIYRVYDVFFPGK